MKKYMTFYLQGFLSCPLQRISSNNAPLVFRLRRSCLRLGKDSTALPQIGTLPEAQVFLQVYCQPRIDWKVEN